MGCGRYGPGQNGTSISSTLLLGVQRQEPGAWERFYRVWGPVVYHHFRSRGIPPADTEDLVQIVFMKVSQAIGQFQRGRFRAWLYQILGHCIADHFRNQKRVPVAKGGTESWVCALAAPEDSSPVAADGDTASFTTPPDSWEPMEVGCLPEDSQAELTEKQLLVRQVLEVIRGDFELHTFRAFWRTTVDGLCSAEVGQELGMTAEAVRAARYRVLRRLRQELEEMGMPIAGCSRVSG